MANGLKKARGVFIYPFLKRHVWLSCWRVCVNLANSMTC
jgi:hypothetical protein